MKTALSDPPPSESEDVLAPQTRVVPKSEKSQVPPEAPSMTAHEGVSFDEVSQEALKAVEEIIHVEETSASPNPPAALVEDPHLCIEDFL